MGLFFSKEDIRKRNINHYLKRGEIYSCEVLPQIEEMFEAKKWDEALKYAISDKIIEDLADVFRPYFKNDARETAEANQIIFINAVYSRCSKSYGNISEGAISFLARKFNNLKEVPIEKYMTGGSFNRENYDSDRKQYNPFLNYIESAKEIFFTESEIETLYNLLTENVISDEDLLGLTDFKQLFDKDFFDTAFLEKHIREVKQKGE